jgi:protein-arginine kinase activator protein McsA
MSILDLDNILVQCKYYVLCISYRSFSWSIHDMDGNLWRKKMLTMMCPRCQQEYQAQYRFTLCPRCQSGPGTVIDDGRITCSECAKYDRLISTLEKTDNFWDKQSLVQVRNDLHRHIAACH